MVSARLCRCGNRNVSAFFLSSADTTCSMRWRSTFGLFRAVTQSSILPVSGCVIQELWGIRNDVQRTQLLKNLFGSGKAPVQAARKALAKMRVTAGDELQETEIGRQGCCQVQPHAGSKVLEVLFGKSVLLKEDIRVRRRKDVVKAKAPMRPLLSPQERC